MLALSRVICSSRKVRGGAYDTEREARKGSGKAVGPVNALVSFASVGCAAGRIRERSDGAPPCSRARTAPEARGTRDEPGPFRERGRAR
ncbi:hypothetical protein Shyd_62070 [Streptomyces hydrogenans]|uniref:Uncharacterized protein n=1 Tax=Streptomyces hydrogenans TaxID=1873719 RepID=A0ABQ3PIJ7_9ACTN|nr:hypothetical protein GCM10018784_32800 [Streptomyces hydrogenans]GHI24836.1 hypothetical protein Shyd_62070 [Streptomyces hydrogenans]